MSARPALLSGFMPFDVFDLNSSYEMLRPLDGATVAGTRLHVMEVPVEFGSGAAALLREAERLDPCLVMSFGLADGPRVRLERLAFNEMVGRIPDNAGFSPDGEEAVQGAPASLGTGLPLDALRDALDSSGIPAGYSDTAGRFVCNDLFYRLMEWRSGDPGAPVRGFVHVPALAGHGGKEGWEPELLERAARVMVEAALRAISR